MCSASTQTEEPTEGETTAADAFFAGPVIGLGASAGGLDALERFFQHMPTDSGAAFVVVQHLSPDHKSMMAHLLSRHTGMAVVPVEDAMALAANRVFLIPPGALLTVVEGRLYLAPKNPRVLSLPIDLFFKSLAKAHGNQAIGIILSGTGSDGTRGGVAINEAGGLLLAQDPETASFDGMPRSIVATGLVDAILAPEALGPRVIAHLQPRLVATALEPSSPIALPPRAAPLEAILNLLLQIGGVNFRDYKPGTLLRRIERRMQVRHVPDLLHYLNLIEGDSAEVATLRREILIPVTRFFRDEAAFEALGQTLRDIVHEQQGRLEPLRIWVAGTSTGEEACSLAILLTEILAETGRGIDFKIFATDVEQKNIDAASAGVFSEALLAEISPERLERYFTSRDHHFVIRSEIRQHIVFARHNLLEDPPFTRMDLVTCRNVLIYFQALAQERVLRRLQYALAPGGLLFLGSSESLSGLQGDFSAISSTHKIYRVLRPASLPIGSPGMAFSPPASGARGPRIRGRAAGASMDSVAIDAGQALLLRTHAPPALLVTAAHDLIHVFGDMQRYLRMPEGQASLDITRLLPSPLAMVAVALLHKAARDEEVIHSEALLLNSVAGEPRQLRLGAHPVTGPGHGESTLLLVFEDVAPSPPARVHPHGLLDIDAEQAQRMAGLERDLAAAREHLQATIEELETANEELQATNEELMASNEELQSSNEELQSVNEELYTVNAENQEKIEILNRLNADLDGMARASNVATLFVDRDLRLTRFTAEASQLFRIRDTDVGRPLEDFSHRLDHPDFVGTLRRTIASGEIFEQEITASNGRCYLARILPYAGPSQGAGLGGAVATFVDVTELSDLDRLQAILNSLPTHVAVVDRDGIITLVNEAWRAFAQANGDPTFERSGPGQNYLEVCTPPGAIDNDESAWSAQNGLRAILAGQTATFTLQYPCHSPDEQRWFLMHAAPIEGPGGGAVVSHINITEWVNPHHAA